MGRRLLCAAAMLLAFASCGGGQEGDPIAHSASEIIGGVPAPDASNIVLVHDQTPNDDHLCSGSLIAPNVVLVQRFCVSVGIDYLVCGDPYGATHDTTQLLVVNGPDTNDIGTPWPVAHIEVPPGDELCADDLALLVLGTVIDGAEASPIPPRLSAPVVVGELFTAYGYGMTDITDPYSSGTRHKREGVEVLCTEGCSLALPGEWVGGVAAAPGDGPAVGNDGKVIGLALRSADFLSEGTYSGVYTHAEWIRTTVAEAATEAGIALPAWVTGEEDAGAGGASGASGSSGAGGAGGGTTDAGTSGGAAGVDSGGIGGAANAPAKADDDESGCSCSAAKGGVTTWWLLVAAAALRFRRWGTHVRLSITNKT